MIDQSLINHIEAVIEDSQGSAVDISTGKLTELLDSYKSLIEQNAELHKLNSELKGRVKSGYEAYVRIEAIKQRYNAENKQKQKMLELAWGAISESGYEDCCNELRGFMERLK